VRLKLTSETMQRLADFISIEFVGRTRMNASRSDEPGVDGVALRVAYFLPRESKAVLRDHSFLMESDTGSGRIGCRLVSVDRGVNNNRSAWKAEPLQIHPLEMTGDAGGVETMYRFHLEALFDRSPGIFRLHVPDVAIDGYFYQSAPISYHFQIDRNSFALRKPPSPAFHTVALCSG